MINRETTAENNTHTYILFILYLHLVHLYIHFVQDILSFFYYTCIVCNYRKKWNVDNINKI